MPNELRPADVASSRPAPTRNDAVKACPTDLSIQCPECGTKMQPEHAHYRCLRCGYRDSCCM
jgi:DNA-directed RNA polymerase subunit RPC12/RpoP